MVKVCDYVAEFISKKSVDTVFSIPGGGCIFLSDSFARNKDIKMVVNHHEQGCALAAEGYARITNNLGVCLVTSGPGGSNAWTGTLCSYQDSVPVMVISGNVNREMTTNYTESDLRQLGDQEFNTVKTVSTFTKYAVQVNDPLTIKYHLERAYYEATTGRPGPVWIDIPLDVSTDKIDVDSLKGFERPDKPIVDINFKDIALKLSQSKKPLLIVGNGVRLGHAIDLLHEILEEYKIPIVASVNGADCVSSEYKYFGGRFGVIGNISANKLIHESDLILSLGSRLYVRQIGYNFKSFAKDAYKIYVDIDKEELDKPTLFPDVKINMDVYDFLSELKNYLSVLSIDSWREQVISYVKTYPTVLSRHFDLAPLSVYAVCSMLNDYMQRDIPVVSSNGCANVVGMQVFKLKPSQRFFINKATAPMGYGLPAAIGAYYGSKQTIFCIEGDGSLHMNIHELQVVAQNNLPIKIIFFNNDGYLSIKTTQRNFCDGFLSLTNAESGLTLPDYSKIAFAYNIKYSSARTIEELTSVFDSMSTNNEPELIEVFTHPDEKHEPKVPAQIDEHGNFKPGELHTIDWVS